MGHTKTKVDKNQRLIMDWLIAAGATVDSLAACGKGIPDLLVGFRGLNILLEVKNPDMPPSKRVLTPDQVTWHAKHGGQVAVVETVMDVMQVLAICNGKRRGR